MRAWHGHHSLGQCAITRRFEGTVAFDVIGRLVDTLVESDLPAGRHAFVWKHAGSVMWNGIYWVRLWCPSGEGHGRILVLD